MDGEILYKSLGHFCQQEVTSGTLQDACQTIQGSDVNIWIAVVCLIFFIKDIVYPCLRLAWLCLRMIWPCLCMTWSCACKTWNFIQNYVRKRRDRKHLCLLRNKARNAILNDENASPRKDYWLHRLNMAKTADEIDKIVARSTHGKGNKKKH